MAEKFPDRRRVLDRYAFYLRWLGAELDPTDRSADPGPRGSTLESGDLGRAGGRPRGYSKKRRANLRRAYPDTYYPKD